jgi:hypothetical protein
MEPQGNIFRLRIRAIAVETTAIQGVSTAVGSERLSGLLPGLPNYENFLKATNRSLPASAVFMKYLLFLTWARKRGTEAVAEGTELYRDDIGCPEGTFSAG